MFIVLSVISKDVVDLWEAVITFLMFPFVVILAFLVNKRLEENKTTTIFMFY
jgi:solute carrier family 8 (sodium/calcium exchanger)